MKSESDIPESQPIPQPADAGASRPQRGRSLLGALLAGIVALLLIGIVLVIILQLGRMRLSQLGTKQPAVAVPPPPAPHPTREALGLQAPPPIVERPVRIEVPQEPEAKIPQPISALPPAELPPALQLPAVGAVPQAAPVPPTHRAPPVWQALAGLPYDRIYGAFLWRPPQPKPVTIDRPTVTQDLVQLHQAGVLAPEAARSIVQERRPLQTLAEIRSQATMLRSPSPTTQPSS